MKLLVTGDSFATFAPKPYHWVQLLSPDAKSISLPGGDISATTFIATQQAMLKTCTHMIFTVTSLNRHIVNTGALSKEDSLNIMLEMANRDAKSFYVEHDIPANTKTSNSGDSPYRLLAGEWHNWQKENTYDTDIDSYVKLYPDFHYIHNRIGNLSLLVRVCEQNNIKLVFSTPFSKRGEIVSLVSLAGGTVFDYMNLLSYDNSVYEVAGDTHHSPKTHIEIAKCFNRRYPEWLES